MVAHQLIRMSTKYRRHARCVIRTGKERHAVQRRREVVSDCGIAQRFPCDATFDGLRIAKEYPVPKENCTDDPNAVGYVDKGVDAGQIVEGSIMQWWLWRRGPGPSFRHIQREIVEYRRGQPQRDAMVRAGQLVDLLLHCSI